MLYNHHHCQFQNTFITPKRNPYPLAVTSYFPLPLAIIYLLSDSMDLPIGDSSHGKNYTRCGLLCLAYLT